ncbi:hypothetical protein ACJMK2_032390 [Sinanodonta woodiana]|uniref:Uncharacterized protein n=1 Tax=Sinanodonta woodiana TaxID=1069815 RepID=A0ABD3X3D1_SINWO
MWESLSVASHVSMVLSGTFLWGRELPVQLDYKSVAETIKVKRSVVMREEVERKKKESRQSQAGEEGIWRKVREEEKELGERRERKDTSDEQKYKDM